MNFTKTKAFADWVGAIAREHPAETSLPEISDDIEFPPYLRKPERGTREYAERIISMINAKVAKLAEKGLRPHPQLLANRQHCTDFLEGRIPEIDSERFIVRRTF